MGKHKTEHKKDTSPHIPQAPKVKESFEIKQFPWTDWQKEVIETILDKNTKIVFISGCAGTSKTILATYCLLELLKEKKISHFTYIRSAIESAEKSIGFLPGIAEAKTEPYIRPLLDKLDELLSGATTDKLIKDGFIKGDLVNFLRGASLSVQGLYADESQNFSFKELVTILTRFGKRSKFIFTGDPSQSDVNGRSGFNKMLDIFDTAESRTNGIHVIKLDKSKIMRSEELKFIVDQLEKYANTNKN